jgi:copper chaperone NosL
MKKNSLSVITKVVLVIIALLFVGSLFYPMWRIELDAPQYPEGLVLQLHSNKIAGDVEIINGLNHYIGMATLHTENFFEFKIIPYIMSFFALLSLVIAFLNKKKGLIVFGGIFVLFVVLAGIDFYRWNYEYGHNLDPNAAIKVPGMAYQPPVLGYKELLNFGAYSIPDVGGWLLVLAGLLLSLIIIKEYKFSK